CPAVFQRCAPPAAQGTLCFASSDCATPLTCAFREDGGGSCQPVPVDGGACDAYASACASDETCFQGQCLPYTANPGEACGVLAYSGRYCAFGFCDNPDGGAGHCQAYGGLNAPCTLGGGSGYSSCDASYQCVNGHCVARVSAGDACAYRGECVTYQACVQGVCTPQAAPG